MKARRIYDLLQSTTTDLGYEVDLVVVQRRPVSSSSSSSSSSPYRSMELAWDGGQRLAEADDVMIDVEVVARGRGGRKATTTTTTTTAAAAADADADDHDHDHDYHDVRRGGRAVEEMLSRVVEYVVMDGLTSELFVELIDLMGP